MEVSSTNALSAPGAASWLSPCAVPSARLLSAMARRLLAGLQTLSAAISMLLAAAPALLSSVRPLRTQTLEQAALNARAERYMQQYGNSVLRLAYSYVHNMADAEDILQETLIRVLDARVSFENTAHERAYIFKSAVNISKNHITSGKLRETDELNEELIAEERRDLSFVWEAVKGLPPTMSEVIHLYYYEGYRTSEIAQLLGRNESTVRSDLKRARERLREMLKEEYDFE